MIRAVIDTNVLVSGLLSPSGNEALILLAMHQGLLHPCFPEAILAEYAAVLARAKFSFPPNEITAVLAMVRANGELMRHRRFRSRLPIRTTPSSSTVRSMARQSSSSRATRSIFPMHLTGRPAW